MAEKTRINLWDLNSIQDASESKRGLMSSDYVNSLNKNTDDVASLKETLVQKSAYIQTIDGKHIVFLGDSMAFGRGNNATLPQGAFVGGFEKLMAETFTSAHIHNYAKDGGTLTRVYNDAWTSTGLLSQKIMDGYTQMKSDGIEPDYIILDGGSNDLLYLYPLTQALSLTVDTIMGTESDTYMPSTSDGSTIIKGLEDIFTQIKTDFPKCKIIYFTLFDYCRESFELFESEGEPFPSAMIDFIMSFDFEDIYSKLKKVCKRYKVQVCDLFNSTIDPRVSACRELYFDDGIHLSLDGYAQALIPLMTTLLNC